VAFGVVADVLVLGFAAALAFVTVIVLFRHSITSLTERVRKPACASNLLLSSRLGRQRRESRLQPQFDRFE
jgi:hypothetical protein